MGWVRGAIGGGMLLGVLAPVVALGPAAVVDRGPGGEVRGTAFHLALAAADPFVWEGLRNSLMAAVAVAVGSLLGGVILARGVGRWRFWGRAPLAALIWAPLAVPPMFAALGLAGWLEGSTLPEVWRGWLGLVWAGTAWGAALVGLAVVPALRRIDPAWEDAARLAGAGRGRTWWQVTWPLVRPDAARAVAAVFALIVIEPGAPMVLGLRRTLGFQIVAAAARPLEAPRAAILALIGLVLAVVGGVLIRWWGGPSWPIPVEAAPARRGRAGGFRTVVLVLPLAGWAVAGLAPVLGLVATAGVAEDVRSGRFSAGAVRELLNDPEARGLVGHSLALGLAVVALGLVPAWAASRSAPGEGPTILRRLAAGSRNLPPLAIAVGAWMVPGLLLAGSDVLPTSGSPGTLARGLRALAEWLGPGRTPGLLLVWAVAAARLPTLVGGADRARAGCPRELADAALSLGASRRRAWLTRLGPLPGSTLGAACLVTFALSASTVAPALVLAPTSSARTLAPGVLLLADRPGDGPRLAAALAVGGVSLNLAALALAARGKREPLGNWFRG